jgi:hypothetical protein
MDPELTKQLAFVAAIIVGQVLMSLIPYLNKEKEDGREFDLNYAYTAVIGFAVMATVALQTDAIMAMELTFPSIMILMFGGAAVQVGIVSKMTPKNKAKMIVRKGE